MQGPWRHLPALCSSLGQAETPPFSFTSRSSLGLPTLGTNGSE